ncbi:MAG: acetylglutamate kinase [Deltaproteobacteria bacterium]|nr:acetylglutamate kinase [Deltaproteobacteria bacterium]
MRRFGGKILVIKYGGSVMVEERLKELVATDIVLLRHIGISPVIVHGGGSEVSRWMKKVGKEAVFIDGLRFTDHETMEITEMVLSGKISNEIVTLINQKGGRALGLSGKDAHLFTAKKIRSTADDDLGLVGEIDKTDVSLLLSLCEKGYIPVISSIGVDSSGKSLNLNADHVAAALARALNALKLIYLTDVEGVILDGQTLSILDVRQVKELLKNPQIKGGMLPKLRYAIEALEGSVTSVHIINGSVDHSLLLEIFTEAGVGTKIDKVIRETSDVEQCGVSS